MTCKNNYIIYLANNFEFCERFDERVFFLF